MDMSAATLLALLLSLWVALGDLRERRVSNRWLLAAAGSGALYWLAAAALGYAQAAGAAAIGLAAGFLVLLPFYAIGWMGAGDVKFFAVLGLLLGWQALPTIWVVGSLLAGAHAALLLAGRCVAPGPAQQLLAPLLHDAAAPLRRDGRADATARRRGLPYATYLAAGALVAVFLQAGAHG